MAENHIEDASTLSGWRKSSYSGSQQGTCVEVLDGFTGGVPVRDSKNPTGPALVVSSAAWGAFLGSL
ncbi:DUF397 domain-containing protein [Streptomyces erythrochromogenes]|uniref:DUF397 domain-containing protein n=1 Tax=Streptomyces erythrochromogenes TaxID=285574 RepID=UPI0037D7DE39